MLQRSNLSKARSGGLFLWIIIAVLKTDFSRGNEFPSEIKPVLVECAESQETCILTCTEILPEESGVLVRWFKVSTFGNHSQLVAAWDRNPASDPFSTGRFRISSNLSLILHNVSKSDAGFFNCSVDRPSKHMNCYNELVVHQDTLTTVPSVRTQTSLSSALPSNHPTTEIHRAHYVSTVEVCMIAVVALVLIVCNLVCCKCTSQTKASHQHCEEILLSDEQALRKHSCLSFNHPSDVIYHDSKCLVADTQNNRILAIDPDEKLILPYHACKENTYPFSLAALSPSKIIFTCSENRCIMGIKDQTEYPWAKTYDQFQRPAGMVVHDNSVFVADNEAGCIHVFDRNGTFRDLIGKGNLSKPGFLAVNSRNQLFVTDDGYIKIFGTDGRYLRVFRPDENKWKLQGIAIDEEDILYVAACQDSDEPETADCTSGVFVVDTEYRTIGSMLEIHKESSCIFGICIDSGRKKLVGVDHYKNLHVEYPLFDKIKDKMPYEQGYILPLLFNVFTCNVQ